MVLHIMNDKKRLRTPSCEQMKLIDKLEQTRHLEDAEYALLLSHYNNALAEYAAQKAVILRKKIYSNHIYIRGLIEISNYCKNNCYYCGIRRGNASCNRYRLNKYQILQCCQEGYHLGFRTFVLQGGEDAYYTDYVLCDIIHAIKSEYPDCAVTLSLGERTKHSYLELFKAGADRYLLRHETADQTHYESLHPTEMSFENRLNCLYSLKEIGYQTGCGFMVGSPNQTIDTLVKDLQFIEKFQPDMCGIGPFIPHHATPYNEYQAGTLELTTFLLSLIRLIKPNILLPATTALGTIHPMGREKGILAGANVIMPNLSPESNRKDYELYDNKLCTGGESAQKILQLKQNMNAIGYEVVTSRGDILS